MKSRQSTVGALALLAGSVAAVPCHAAVTVLGNGIGAACYQAAEYGGGIAQGIELCTEALDQEALSKSDRAATYINRGILLSQRGDPEGALKDYNAGLSMDASHSEGYVDRGATYIALQRYREALDDIDKGIAMGAKKLQIAYYDRAIAREAIGDVRAAYLDYKKAVELAPDFALAQEQLRRFKVVRKEGETN